jgi:hypothetical protein
MCSGMTENLRGKSLISSVAWKAPASGPRLSIGTPDLITPARLSRAWMSATADPTLSSGFFDALAGSLSVLWTVILPSRSIPLGTPGRGAALADCTDYITLLNCSSPFSAFSSFSSSSSPSSPVLYVFRSRFRVASRS